MNLVAYRPAHTTLMDTPDKLPDDKWSAIINYLGMLFAGIILAILTWVGKFVGKKFEAYVDRVEAAADKIEKVGERIDAIDKKIEHLDERIEKRMDSFERRIERIEEKK